jgi:hypothetical protein
MIPCNCQNERHHENPKPLDIRVKASRGTETTTYAAKARQATTMAEPTGQRMRTGKQIRQLTEEELTSIRFGRPLTKRPIIMTTYFTGVKRTRIIHIKSFLFTIGVNLKKILNIGFIGRSVAEVYVYDDYKQELEDILTKNECIVLTDFDPTSSGNFKLPIRTCLAFDQQEANAVSMHKKRITHQLERLPEHMFRLWDYLQQKLKEIKGLGFFIGIMTSTW